MAAPPPRPVDAPPPRAAREQCCVCGEPAPKYCPSCKSRNYCGKKCQRTDWRSRGHRAQCNALAAEFQDRLHDKLMPPKPSVAPADEYARADGPKARAAKAPAPAASAAAAVVRPAGAVARSAVAAWRDFCAICRDALPLGEAATMLYWCCCARLCVGCAQTCRRYDARCPLCRQAPCASVAEGLKWLRSHAAKGRAVAMHALGRHLNLGDGVQMDQKAAFNMHCKAAAQGLPEAQCRLGLMCVEGHGTDTDYLEAVKWFQLAAEQGDPDALYLLGGCYTSGEGLARNYTLALKWLRRAVKVGSAGAAEAVREVEAAMIEAAVLATANAPANAPA
jgi:TPR repeat protein